VNLNDSTAAAMPQLHRPDFSKQICTAVCRPGVEPLAGFTKQNARKCRPGFAKKGNGNFK
jgi:hypothetical protein